MKSRWTDIHPEKYLVLHVLGVFFKKGPFLSQMTATVEGSIRPFCVGNIVGPLTLLLLPVGPPHFSGCKPPPPFPWKWNIQLNLQATTSLNLFSKKVELRRHKIPTVAEQKKKLKSLRLSGHILVVVRTTTVVVLIPAALLSKKTFTLRAFRQ